MCVHAYIRYILRRMQLQYAMIALNSVLIKKKEDKIAHYHTQTSLLPADTIPL